VTWTINRCKLQPDARIQRFGGYATGEVALAPEPFDARHHWWIFVIDLVQELVRAGRV
jgi:hypothetical protein